MEKNKNVKFDISLQESLAAIQRMKCCRKMRKNDMNRKKRIKEKLMRANYCKD